MVPYEFSRVAQDLTRFLDEIVSINPIAKGRDCFELKIDIFEKLIQIIRHETNYAQNNLSLDQLLRSNIYVDDNDRRVYIDLAQQREEQDTADLLKVRSARNLQASLIGFLLLNFRRHNSVLSIIENFIDEIKPSLSIKDFEKTKTGVIRCFTNTRFTAKHLRDFGLLKFTQKEAYKVWELSFLGVLVSAQIFEESWRTRPSDSVQKLPLDSRILDALARLKNTNGVRGVLEYVCKDKDIFPSFDIILSAFDKLAKIYLSSDLGKRNDLQNIKLETSTLLSLLEKNSWIERFMQELSQQSRIEECMRTVRHLLNPR
ncbi:hypothetical protein KJ068_02145 [bacterium]|nr:hypothetical protein [bacterium]